jgi:hypothetical protein
MVATAMSSFGAGLSRAKDGTVFGVSAITPATNGKPCNTSGGIVYTWEVTDGAGVAVDVSGSSYRAATSTLLLPARSLATGTRASAAMTACYASAPSSKGLCGRTATVTFSVVSTPLVAVLSGGGGIVGEVPVKLDASKSNDPDGEAGALSFAWSCATAAGGDCLTNTGAALALEAGATSQTITLLGSGVGNGYTIAVTVSKAGRASVTASTTLTVKSGSLPLIALQGLGSPLALASNRLVLLAAVTSRAPASVRSVWSVRGTGPALNLSSPLVAATPVTSASLVLLPGALAPGGNYTFRLTAADSDGEAYAELAVPVASSPKGFDGSPAGSLAVSPAVGTALETQFTLTAGDDWVGDGPLLYSFLYRTAPDAELVTLSAYKPSPTLTALLPAGAASNGNTLTLYVRVQSAAGAVSAADGFAFANVKFVDVTAFTPTALASYSANLASNAAAAVSSGNPEAALQLVGGLAALLLSTAAPPSPPPPPGTSRAVGAPPAPMSAEEIAAQQARIAQRENLLDIVGSVNNLVPPTPEGAASTVSLVSSIVSSTPASELSPTATAKALDIMSSVTGSGVTLSPAAVNGIGNALSSLSGAALSSANAAGARGGSTKSAGTRSGRLSAASQATTRSAAATRSCAMLAKVVDVLDSLTSSQLSRMAVPGETPSLLSTANIKAYTALDDFSDANARLFQANTTVLGALASFAPLDASQLADAAAASVDGLAGGVSVSFYELAFDPWTCGATNSSSTARMSLADAAGNALHVNHLEDLITFSMAAPPADEVDPASEALYCAWWNDVLGEYSTDGCVTLPNPSPDGVSLTFTGDLSGPGMKRAWNASGAMFADCTLEFLDCGSAPEGQIIFLDPSDVYATPGVKCQPGSKEVLRLYTGHDCLARQANNSARCFWDAETQAFAGEGCILSPFVRAGATHLTDFMAFHMPRSPLAMPHNSMSLKEMLSPAGISTLWTRLRWMLVTVGGAALLTVLAAMVVHVIIDKRASAAALAAVQRRRLGFARKAGGVWTWTLSPRTQAVNDTDPGSLAALAELAGVPPARLRMAVPEELLSGSLAAVLGRRAAAAAARAAASAHKGQPVVARRSRMSASLPLPRTVRPAPLDVSNAALQLVDENGVDDDSPSTAMGRDGYAYVPEPPSPSVRPSMVPRPWRASLTSDCEGAAGLQAETLASTALVFAFLSARRLVPPGELAKRRAAAAAYFIGEEERASDAGALGVFDFDDLVRKFTVMLASDSLRGEKDWLGAARLWRLALLQERDGSWDASAGLAFALHATAPAGRFKAGAADPLAASPEAIAAALPPALQRLRDGRARADADAEGSVNGQMYSSSMMASMAAADAFAAAEAAEAAASALASTRRDGIMALLRAAQGDDDDDASHSGSDLASASGASADFGAGTRGEKLVEYAGRSGVLPPPPRSSSPGASEDDFPMCGPIDIERVWATALAVAAADRMDFGYAAQPPSRRNPVGATVVDLGFKWLEDTAAEEPLLRAVLPLVQTAAAMQVEQWCAAHAARVAPLRRAESATPAAVAKARAARADAAKAALAGGIAPSATGRRAAWQRFVSGVTLGVTILAIAVGMVANRADACCAQLRQALGCSADVLEPCMGIAGDQCASLEATFRGQPNWGAAELVCVSFPAPRSWADRLFAAVLVAAVTLPLKLFLGACWDAASEAADPVTLDAWRSREHGPLRALLTGSWRKAAAVNTLGKTRSRRGWQLAGDHAPNIILRFFASIFRCLADPVTAGMDFVVDFITGAIVLLVRPAKHRRGGVNTVAAAAGASDAARYSEATLSAASDGGRISGDSLAATLSPVATAHLNAASAANRRAAVRAVVSSALGVVATVFTWTVLAYCVFAFGLRIYAQLGVSAEVQVGWLWVVGVCGSVAAEWLATAARAAAAAAGSGLSELLQNRSDSAWLAAQLDYVAAAAVRESAKAKKEAALLRAKALAGPSKAFGRQGSRIAPDDGADGSDEDAPKKAPPAKPFPAAFIARRGQVMPADGSDDEQEAPTKKPMEAVADATRRWSPVRSSLRVMPSAGSDEEYEEAAAKKGVLSPSAMRPRLSQVAPVDFSESEDESDTELPNYTRPPPRFSMPRISTGARKSYYSVDFSVDDGHQAAEEYNYATQAKAMDSDEGAEEPAPLLSRISDGECPVFAIAARLRVLTRVRYPFCLSQLRLRPPARSRLTRTEQDPMN